MSIKYCLLPNHLSSKANAHRALVQGARPATVAEVIDRMTARGSGITKAGILGVFEAAQSVIEDLLLEGRGITSEFINIMPSVRGIFDGADDRFDPARHTVRINVFPGARLQKTTADMRLQKVRGGAVVPVIDAFQDVQSGSSHHLTSGGVGVLQGANLKIRAENVACGVFFIARDRTVYPVTRYLRNEPAELIFTIPELPAGAYTLKVTTCSPNATTVRSRSLTTSLVVEG